MCGCTLRTLTSRLSGAGAVCGLYLFSSTNEMRVVPSLGAIRTGAVIAIVTPSLVDIRTGAVIFIF